MSRIRTIKPEFWSSEQIMECSPNARLMFIGLWNFCDDAGRRRFSPKQIKALIFPSDDFTSENILGWFDELSSNGLVVKYIVDDVEYLEVTGWKHQKIDRPQRSKIPPPNGADTEGHSTNVRRTFALGREGKGEEEGRRKKERKEEGAPLFASTSENATAGKDAPRGATTPPPSTGGNGGYAFEAGCIKLNAKNLEQWRAAFPNLSLEAELTALVEWAGTKPNWFPAVAGALAKRQREARARIDAAKTPDPPNDHWDPAL